MPRNHRLIPESRKIFAVVLTVLFLAGCQAVQPVPEPQPVQSPVRVHGPVCGGRQALVDQLKAEYAERPKSIGLAANGSVLEILTAKTGTWTVLVTTPQGVTCLLAAGEHWQDVTTREVGPSS